LNVGVEAPEVYLNQPIDAHGQSVERIESSLPDPTMAETDNKFNRNFILVLKTVRAYGLFD